MLQSDRFRLLIVDDMESIHDDLKKILLPREIDSQLAADEAFLFGKLDLHHRFERHRCLDQSGILGSLRLLGGRSAWDKSPRTEVVQFRQEGFRELIKQVLDETGLDSQYLELELTESLLLSNADVMFKVLEDLRGLGIKLVIDDFGTGYSSQSYLRQFPVTKLKIDRSFIRDVAVNPSDAAITTAIISMAKSLDLKVIAEGVENEAQLSFLRERKCDEVKGYYFSRPLSAQDVASKLRKPLMSMIEEKLDPVVA